MHASCTAKLKCCSQVRKVNFNDPRNQNHLEHDLNPDWSGWNSFKDKGRVLKFRPGETVYHDGLLAGGIFLLLRGSVKLTTVTDSGTARIIELVTAGELFGLDSLAVRPTRVSTAVARENSETAFLATPDFRKLLHERHDLLWRLSLMVNEMLHRSYRHQLSISGLRVRERIQSVLIDLSGRLSGLDTQKPGFARLKQRELAEIIGVPEETVCREMRELSDSRRFRELCFVLDVPRRIA